MNEALNALYVHNKNSTINDNIEIFNEMFKEIKNSFIEYINLIEWLNQDIKNDYIEEVNKKNNKKQQCFR